MHRFYYFETLVQALRDTLQNRAGFLNLFCISVIICVFFYLIQPQTTIYKQKNATKHKHSHGLQGKKTFFNLFK